MKRARACALELALIVCLSCGLVKACNLKEQLVSCLATEGIGQVPTPD